MTQTPTIQSVKSSRPVGELIANRSWRRRLVPFPHVTVSDLFEESFADEIDGAVRAILASQPMTVIPNYDASGWLLPPDVDWPLRVFLTPEWRAMVSRALGVETGMYVSASIHHHEPGGPHGRPHCDLNPVYFADVEPIDDVVQLRGDLVEVKSSNRVNGYDGPILSKVRAIALLYYTANPPWSRGDGGQTGLYLRRSDPSEAPAIAVPPRNNSMVAFECTPHSYHSFMANRLERNSITMWLHRTYDETVDRWTEPAIERWPESPPPRGS